MKELCIRDILVPIDFSEISIRAIPVARQLAQRLGARIHLAHIQEPFYPAMYYGVGAPAPVALIDAVEEARKSAGARLEALAKEHRLTGTTRSRLGAPVFDELCLIARRMPADLIVTSTHGRTGLKHLLLGSTAERLVQHSPCPVFVARERKGKARKPGAINVILVPIDFSSSSLKGLQYAIQFAREFVSKVIVLHVVDIAPTLGADGLGIYELTRYTERARAEAEKKMPLFLRSVKLSGVKIETRVIHGRSADAICAAATKANADLIITATHGRTGLRHILIGSTAEVVVRYAPCPVLVVPSHPVERRKRLRTTSQMDWSPRAAVRITRPMKQTPLEPEPFTRRFRKTVAQRFPERRKTNKFRESHA